LHVRVRINSTRHDQLSARVENLATCGYLQIRPDGLDDTVGTQDIRAHTVIGVDYSAPSDQQ
jgi:hypothetical protein